MGLFKKRNYEEVKKVAEKIAKKICKKLKIDFLKVECSDVWWYDLFYARTKYGDKTFEFSEEEQKIIKEG